MDTTSRLVKIPEDMLRKIRKMLKVTTERGASETEAAFAAQRVREVLDQYNLTVVDIAEKEGVSPVVTVVSRGPNEEERGAWMGKAAWQRILANQLSELYDCQYLITPSHLYFVGDPIDTEVCAEVYLHIVKQVKRMRALFLKPLQGQMFIRGMGNTYALGCAGRICERIRDIIRVRKSTLTSTVTALVVNKQEAIKLKLKDVPSYRPQTVRHNQAAFERGYEDGNLVEINKLVKEGR